MKAASGIQSVRRVEIFGKLSGFALAIAARLRLAQYARVFSNQSCFTWDAYESRLLL
jgi:hypothetical protein